MNNKFKYTDSRTKHTYEIDLDDMLMHNLSLSNMSFGIRLDLGVLEMVSALDSNSWMSLPSGFQDAYQNHLFDMEIENGLLGDDDDQS